MRKNIIVERNLVARVGVLLTLTKHAWMEDTSLCC